MDDYTGLAVSSTTSSASAVCTADSTGAGPEAGLIAPLQASTAARKPLRVEDFYHIDPQNLGR